MIFSLSPDSFINFAFSSLPLDALKFVLQKIPIFADVEHMSQTFHVIEDIYNILFSYASYRK